MVRSACNSDYPLPESYDSYLHNKERSMKSTVTFNLTIRVSNGKENFDSPNPSFLSLGSKKKDIYENSLPSAVQ